MGKTKKVDQEAVDNLNRLLQETVEQEGDMFLVSKSNDELGSFIMGDAEKIGQLMAFLASKDPEVREVMLHGLHWFMRSSLEQIYGAAGVRKLNKFLQEEMPVPHLNWGTDTPEA